MIAGLLFVLPVVLTVGDRKQYSRIEEALTKASPGAVIEVYPKEGGYSDVLCLVRTPRITIRGVSIRPVRLSGGQTEYSGVGKIPRAIFQIDPGANGVVIAGFELSGAHNQSFNGAGVRINGADGVCIAGCDIHDNDMGVMSNGATDQLIERCTIHSNGNAKDPGYNHNLYLGGGNVTVQYCDIFDSITGHNLKSRAHFNLIQYCCIHGAANRELDFVDADETKRPNSNVVLIGNIIAKDEACKGNRTTIHFGREKGTRDGTLYLFNNTVVTPFHSPVIAMTNNFPRAQLMHNEVINQMDPKPILLESKNPIKLVGDENWFSQGYKGSAGELPNSTFGNSQPFSESPVRRSSGFYRDGSGKSVAVQVNYPMHGNGASVRVDGAHYFLLRG